MTPAPHRVAILAYDRLCTFEFGCAIELFALPRPELRIPWYSHSVFSVDTGPLRALGGVEVIAPHGLSVTRRAQTIVIPGWRDIHERPPQRLLDALVAAAGRGARICSLCSGVFVIAHAGLLHGRRAATHWRYAATLAQQFPGIDVDADALYVDEGNVITAAGSAAGLDMLLHLVRRDHGAGVANTVAQRLVMAPHRDGGQAQFVPRPVPTRENGPVARSIDWMRANPRAAHTLASLAERAGVSTRTLQRRFAEATGFAPIEWLVRERISLARELIERDPRLPVERVAELAGFGSAETMRHHFRMRELPAPSRYRRQFAEPARR